MWCPDCNPSSQIPVADCEFIADPVRPMHRQVLRDSRKSLVNAFVDMQESMSKFRDCRDLHDLACRDLQDAGTRVTEAKRKADDAQDQIKAHRDRSSRVSEEYGTAEEDLNECLERMEQVLRDTAKSNTRCHAEPLIVIPMKSATYKKLRIWHRNSSNGALVGKLLK